MLSILLIPMNQMGLQAASRSKSKFIRMAVFTKPSMLLQADQWFI